MQAANHGLGNDATKTLDGSADWRVLVRAKQRLA